ncbi:MAG: FAD binding domain-containing protein, partial [Rhodospirillaceae bacterium]
MAAYHRPTDLQDALAWLAETGGRVAAGCTDLFPGTDRPALAGQILDVTAIAGLRGIAESAEGWRIGAATTWTDVLRTDLPAAFDGLKLAAREVGSVQIQNAGTLGGNLCNASPAADGVPPLLTLDAAVELASASGTRTLPLPDFIRGPRDTALQPDELMTAILIPQSAGAGAATFLKLGARKYLVISIAMVAARLTVAGSTVTYAAVAVGACSAV